MRRIVEAGVDDVGVEVEEMVGGEEKRSTSDPNNPSAMAGEE